MFQRISYILVFFVLTTSSETYGQHTIDSAEIACDMISKNKRYKITLTTFDPTSEDETKPNAIFRFSMLTDGQYTTVFSDSIYSTVQEVKFDDFNNDGIKDILVQNFSDIRSNWTYYLYLVDTLTDRLKKIKGFEEIKNPNYIAKYDLIDNYVMSGRNWTTFYKIQNDTIKAFDIVVYDNQQELDGHTYKKGYDKAIKTILVRQKNNR